MGERRQKEREEKEISERGGRTQSECRKNIRVLGGLERGESDTKEEREEKERIKMGLVFFLINTNYINYFVEDPYVIG